MRIRNILIAGAIAAVAAFGLAHADVNYTQGSGTVIFDFTCFTTKHCSAHTPINSAGTEIFTSSTPGQVTGANGTFPATQSGTWTVQPGNTANTTPWLHAIANSAGSTIAQVVANSDALGNQAGVSANAQNQVYNGTTWDRMREATADAMAVTGLQGMAGLMYNGTTWDRFRGDTTNGLWVNVKAITGQNANGQAAMSGSAPVTVATDQRISTATSSAAINISTATTTQLVALSGSTKIYVMNWNVVAGGTGNITLVYGTGTNCGTGTTSLTGAYNLTAQAGLAPSGGAAPVLVVPAGNALCATTSAAVQMSGSVAYQQF